MKIDVNIIYSVRQYMYSSEEGAQDEGGSDREGR